MIPSREDALTACSGALLVPITTRLKQLAPYVVILVGAVGFYRVADHIAYTAIPDQIGPEVWPKMILILLMLVCVFEIARLTWRASETEPSEAPSSTSEQEFILPESPPDNPVRVAGVIVATVVYLLAIDSAGFFLCTLVYSGCLMWLGGVRRPSVIGALSIIMTVFFMFMFMKIIFVALPIGVGPFSRISLAVMTLIGIR